MDRSALRRRRREDFMVKVLAALLVGGIILGAVALSYWAHDGDIKCMVNDKCRVVKVK